MGLDAEIGKFITQLVLKVLTPIMVFTLLIFSGTGYLIFQAPEVSPTFDFDSALWTWLIVCWAFTPLCGAIMWIQSVRAIHGTARKKKKPRTTPAAKKTGINA
jgi:hypothetical protein